ncbi:MAG: T9SS type A sorting domain-containing protein [Bacteroidetes bacterium]|nr:T9SS type A sorting domain-containing protein [Bacteroidota bacterium]
MKYSFVRLIQLSMFICAILHVNQTRAQGNFEDFETLTGWPWAPWVEVVPGGVKIAAAAHTGSYGVEDPAWHYRTDIIWGNAAGEQLEIWVKFTANNARMYLGFEADSGGCLSFVAAPSSGEFILQENVGFGYNDLNSLAFNYSLNKWYKIGIYWADTNYVKGTLYDSDGTTALRTLSYIRVMPFRGGVAIRGFGCYVDDLSGCTTSLPAFGYDIDPYTGNEVHFSDSSENVDSWLWDFGDGYLSTLQNPDHTYATDGTYTVCLTATSPGGCVDSVCVSTNIVATGMQDISMSEVVRIYPNPFSTHTTLYFNNYKQDEYTFVLYNVLGEEVRRIEQITTNQKEIRRSNLPKGLYIYKVIDNDNILLGTGKLVVE